MKELKILLIFFGASLVLNVFSFVLIFAIDAKLKDKNKQFDNLQFSKIIVDTVYIKVPYIKYIDTCDSQFMKSIIEVETRNYSKLKKGIPLKTKPTGGGGLYIGQFQMSRIYFEGCTLAEVLGYSYNQMFDPEKAFHVFWAKMGVYAYRFKKQHGRAPTYEELARIHAGGYSQRFKPSTNKYANHFNKWYKTKLD